MVSKANDVIEQKGKPIEITDPFARRLIGKYLDKRNDDVDRLTRALAESDFESIRTTGHNLYGSGAAYGLDAISDLGARMERAAIDRDGPRIRELIGEMTKFLRDLTVC